MFRYVLSILLLSTALQAFAVDWEYSVANVCYGAQIAKEEGRCSDFSGSTRAICSGLKNALGNSCSDLSDGDAKLACLGFREAHKKGNCNKVSGIGRDTCLAYASSIADSSVCSTGTNKQKAMCYGLVYAWTDQNCEN